jgi:dipeptidyl aminopeptidase/acylaminoacyl peptidase
VADVWWLETMSEQQGRNAVRRRGVDGVPVDVLPAPWNARTRAHEYGGGSWTTVHVPGAAGPSLVFTEFSDQRMYRLDPAGDQPVPLTPIPPTEAGARYADLTPSPDGREIWCVRESHAADGTVSRDIVAVPAEGQAGEDHSAVRILAAGSHFLAYPTASPDGRRLAWIAWNHPQMPWDGTELRVADLSPDGSFGDARILMGSTSESVLQPSWVDDSTLTVVSDRTGWWNLYRVDAAGGAPRALCPIEADFAGALWVFGLRWYASLPDGRLFTVRTFGSDTLAILDPETGELVDVTPPAVTSVELVDVDADRALILAAGPQSPTALRMIRLADGVVQDIRSSVDEEPDEAYLPHVEAMTFRGAQGRDVHSFVYQPRNPAFVGPDDERPPFIAFVHGGPTSHDPGILDLTAAYFTSRGIGVVVVNYGGSTGYGRAYREQLRGQWGIVDVEDTVSVLQGLVDQGLADPRRLAIRGGSAGGWTVLAALTGTDAFACGTSYFGVAELLAFADDTHDFESRYLDGLIGPLPESRDLYEQRAPLNHVDTLSCPVLLLQGLDDPIVPPSQAELFRDALVRKGIPHAYLAFEGESHGFRKAATKINSLEAELSFYGQVLGFDPPGVPGLLLTTA